jgi:hypothetical protein
MGIARLVYGPLELHNYLWRKFDNTSGVSVVRNQSHICVLADMRSRNKRS